MTSQASTAAAADDIRLSVTIMHHPRRADRIPELVAACSPLRPQIAIDPEPGGIPSPLRTAKRAWAQVGADSTHHLVLQDDVVLVPGFAGHLLQAVAARRDHAISLYSHWDSPQNSYLVRRAVVAGSAWAPLSTAEWTPTQGLVLPADQARGLARFLAGIPDVARDDDEMVVIFCRDRKIPVVATVPHLVDHRDSPTIVGHPGTFHATIFSPVAALAADHWTADPLAQSVLAERCAPGNTAAHAVELRHSRCALRFFRPGTGEPVEHQFGWYWHDWCPALGIDPELLLRAGQSYQQRRPDRLPPVLTTEVWAAGYLLGADAPRGSRGRADLTRAAMASWIRSGLAPADRAACDRAIMAALADLGVAAIEAGRTHGE